MCDGLLCLGVITGVHGVRGEVRIKPFTETPELLASYGALQTDADGATCKVKRHRIAKGLVIATLQGVNDRTAAEALKGTKLFVRRDKLPDLEDEDEFYHADLVGLKAKFEDGTVFGKVVSLQEFGAGDVIEIEPENGGETVYLPFTRAVVPEVNLSEGHIIVVQPGETE